MERGEADGNQMQQEQHQQRLCRMLAVGDALLEQLQRAVGELNRTVVKQRTLEKTVKNSVDGTEKYSEETLCETEGFIVCESPVDRAGLKQLVATLSELRQTLLPSEEKQDEMLRVLFAPEAEELGA